MIWFSSHSKHRYDGAFFLYKFGKDDFIFLPQIILLLKDSSSVDWKSKRSYL